MKLNILLAVLMAMYTIGINAQEMTSDQESQAKKKMNDIKRSENVVYAETLVEYMADDGKEKITAAQQKSMQLLQTHVIEIFAKRMKMEKKDVQEIWDVIDDKCQNIEVRKGDIVRVFTYVMKDALGLSRTKPKEKDLKEYFGSDSTEVQTTNAVPSQAEAFTSSEIQADTISSPTTPDILSAQTVPDILAVSPNHADSEEQIDSVKSTPTPVTSETPVEATTPVDTIPITTTLVIEATPVTETTPTTGTIPVATTPVVTEPQFESVVEINIPDICKTLIEKKDMTTLLTYLDTEKAYEKLIYGNYRSMRNPEECYIVIVDKSTRKIVSVLDKGKVERMNFITKKMDNYNNYRGGGNYSAVFVQEL